MARNLQVQLQLNTAAAKKALTDLTNETRKALNPNSSTSAFVKENQALDQMAAKLKLLVGVQGQLANQKGMSQEYAKVSTEIATILARQKQMVTTEEQYLKLLQAETNARKAAASVKPASGGGSLSGVGGGASQVFGAAGLPGGGLIGASGPYGVLLTASTQLAKVFDDMGKKAEETSKIISDSGGKYDQLATSALKVKQANDRLADDPVFAAFEKFKNDLQSVGIDTLKRGIDLFAEAVDHLPGIGRSDEQRSADAKKAADAEKGRTTKLKGDALVEYENLKHDRISMEKEIAMSEQEFAVETARKKRDLELETKKFELEQARKQADLEKQLARENQDYALEKQKLTADVAFQTSQKKFAMDIEFENRAFQQKINDEKQDLSLKLSDARQDFNLQQSFKAQDYAKDAARRGEDFRDRLTDMARSGAGGIEYLQANREFTKANRRAAEDYATEQQRAGVEFGVTQGRDVRNVSIQQGREIRDFGQNRQKAVAEHLLEVQQHQYELGLQQLELDIRHNRAIQDVNTNLERLAQDTAIGRQELTNKKNDLNQDIQIQRQKMDFDEAEKRRSQSNKEFEFGGNLANQLPTGDLQNLLKSNPELAQFVQGDFARKGLPMPSAGNSAFASGSLGKDAVGAVQKYIAAHPELSKEARDFLKQLSGNAVPAFADGGYYDSDQPGFALIHPKELILNKEQQTQLFGGGGSHTGFGYGVGGANGLVPINPSDHAGFGYGPGGATGLAPIGMTANNGTANGAPVAASPVTMPGYGVPQVSPVQMPSQVNLNIDAGGAGDAQYMQMLLQLKQMVTRFMGNAQSENMTNQQRALTQYSQYSGQFRG